MIRRLAALAASLVAYVCVATCIALAMIAGYLASSGRLTREKMVQMLAVYHGIELAQSQMEPESAAPPPPEQASLEQIAEARAIHVRYLELREQALKSALEQIQFEGQKLADETKLFRRQKDEFETRLLALQKDAENSGAMELTSILEKIKAKQAKEQILQMLKNDEMDQVVLLLANMQDSKRARIIGEFKTAEESTKLAEVLRRIREGEPASDLAGKTQQQINPAPPNP